MLKVISALVFASVLLFPPASRSVTDSDAAARASGNRKAVAVAIGRDLFTTQWPAQVLNVYADGIGTDVVAGLRVSGERFHAPLTRSEFFREIEDLVRRTFAASAAISEVDVWATVPLSVGKGVDVAGDLAEPAWATVFSVSVRRSESGAALAERLQRGAGVFWDQDWARASLNR